MSEIIELNEINDRDEDYSNDRHFDEVLVNKRRTSKMESKIEWLKARQKGIGGSDCAAILGLSPWKTPIQVYDDKVSPEPIIIEENERMHWGTRLEKVIAEEYEDHTNSKLKRVNKILQHKTYPFLIGNIDRVILSTNGRGTGLLEIKTTSGFSEKTWEDEIPVWYYAQVQHYLSITGYKWAHVAMLVDGHKFSIVPVERDEAYIEIATTALVDFWQNNVEKKISPELTVNDKLEKYYPKSNEGSSTEAAKETFEAYLELKVLKSKINLLSSDKKELEQTLKIVLKDYETLTFEGNTIITWKSSKPSMVIDTDKLMFDHPEIYKKYLEEKPGPRRFLTK